MGMANINERKTVEQEYTVAAHNQYLKEIDENPNQLDLRCTISIRDRADKSGAFHLTHGWQRTDGENAYTEGELETYVDWDCGGYNSVIDSIIRIARTGMA